MSAFPPKSDTFGPGDVGFVPRAEVTCRNALADLIDGGVDFGVWKPETTPARPSPPGTGIHLLPILLPGVQLGPGFVLLTLTDSPVARSSL